MSYVIIEILDNNNAIATYKDGYSIGIYGSTLAELNDSIALLLIPIGESSKTIADSTRLHIATIAETKDIDISLLDKIA